MAKKADITPLTRIGDLLDAFPEVEEILISQAPAFKKLRNPVLRRTVARIATIERAAAIAGIPVPDLVNALRRAAGLEVARDLEAGAPVEPAAREDATLPGWVEAASSRETIDADALLDAGEVPLAPVLKRARELSGSEILVVLSSFRPVPLVEKLRESGFRIHVRPVDAERFETYVAAQV